MDFVSRVDNAFVWAKQGGVYRQTELYRRGEQLFMKWGGGFVRLCPSGSTTASKVIWMEVDPGDDAILELKDGGLPKYLGSRNDVAQIRPKQAA